MKVSDSSSSSTSSLGNTSLRGFSGLASGLDRDALIEQLTLNTSNKITGVKQNITKQEWRQEAYNSITGKMLDMEDDYLSYSGKTSVINNDLYKKSIITATGNSSSASLLKATGSSGVMDYLSIKGVSQLASSAYYTSKRFTVSGEGGEETAASKRTMLSDLGFTDDQLSGMTINGTSFSVTSESTVNDLISAINNSEAGVKATFVESTGSFMFFDKDTGADSTIELNSEAETMFGGTQTAGKDTIMYVSYGGSDPVAVKSSSNTVNVDGLRVTASGIFGNVQTDSSGNVTSYDGSASVSFTASANVDKATERVKEFIDTYNKLVDEVNTAVTTRPNRDYTPLTEAQEDEMTESEIEKWNKKAKEGILYNENEVRDFSDTLHGMMSSFLGAGISYADLKEIGITMTDDFADGGQLKFDEDKFRQAMESDPEKVEKVMCGSSDSKGLGSVINDQFTPYATRYASRNGNSYGRLIEVAGSDKLTLTAKKNQIYNKIEGYNDELKKWESKLKIEEDRYIKQFTNLEKLINSMNSQSNYLSGLFA